jgi:hypothetical protein
MAEKSGFLVKIIVIRARPSKAARFVGFTTTRGGDLPMAATPRLAVT